MKNENEKVTTFVTFHLNFWFWFNPQKCFYPRPPLTPAYNRLYGSQVKMDKVFLRTFQAGIKIEADLLLAGERVFGIRSTFDPVSKRFAKKAISQRDWHFSLFLSVKYWFGCRRGAMSSIWAFPVSGKRSLYFHPVFVWRSTWLCRRLWRGLETLHGGYVQFFFTLLWFCFINR